MAVQLLQEDDLAEGALGVGGVLEGVEASLQRKGPGPRRRWLPQSSHIYSVLILNHI